MKKTRTHKTITKEKLTKTHKHNTNTQQQKHNHQQQPATTKKNACNNTPTNNRNKPKQTN